METIVDSFFTILLIVNILLSFIIVFQERKEATQTWAWLLVLMFIPAIRFILHIFLGRRISKEKIFDLKIQGKVGRNLEIKKGKQALMRGPYPRPPTGQVDMKQLIYMLTVFESTLYTTKNEITLLTGGREELDVLIEDIKQTGDYIRFQYYIYRSDISGEEVRGALTEATRHGVKVRALLNTWGPIQVFSSFFQDLKKAGREVAFFFPLFVPHINPRTNYRNHRKIVVVDGKIGYTSGFNVGNKYLGLIKKFGYWRDDHLRIYGEAVYTLQNRFLIDWNFQCTKEVGYSPEFSPTIHPIGGMAVQVVTDGPDTEYE